MRFAFSYTIVTNVLVRHGDERVEARVQTSTPHSYTCTYQRLVSHFYYGLMSIVGHTMISAAVTISPNYMLAIMRIP